MTYNQNHLEIACYNFIRQLLETSFILNTITFFYSHFPIVFVTDQIWFKFLWFWYHLIFASHISIEKVSTGDTFSLGRGHPCQLNVNYCLILIPTPKSTGVSLWGWLHKVHQAVTEVHSWYPLPLPNWRGRYFQLLGLQEHRWSAMPSNVFFFFHGGKSLRHHIWFEINHFL